MTSTFMGLEIGKRGLFATQTGLNTVGHNITNANTPGYSRQRVNFDATPAMYYPGAGNMMGTGQLGTGVAAQSIERVRDQFLDTQFRNENKGVGEWEVRQDTLSKLQAIFNEPSDTGLSKVLNNFYTAWQSLGRDPENLPARSVVKQATSDLVNTINTLDSKLSQLDADTGQNCSNMVSQFNTITGQIVEINKQITTLETLGDKANDLRDQRDYLVDQLSKMADVSTTELANGTYQVSVGGTMIINGPAPAVQITYDSATNTTSIPITGGQIGGTMGSRSEYVNAYRSQLDSLVNGLVNGKFTSTLPNDYTFGPSVTTMPYEAELPDGSVMHKGDAITPGFVLPANTKITFAGINELHSFGYTMQSPTTQAGPLFVTNDGSTTFTAANLRVSSDILDDVRNIASSDTYYVDASGKNQVKSGNGDVAFMIGGAVSATIDFKDGLPPNAAILTKGTVSDYMRAIVGQLGAQGQTADRQATNSQALVDQVDNRRQSVSGVSIDEEMSNMIKYQQSYAAAARMINTVDTMLDTVINRMMS